MFLFENTVFLHLLCRYAWLATSTFFSLAKNLEGFQNSWVKLQEHRQKSGVGSTQTFSQKNATITVAKFWCTRARILLPGHEFCCPGTNFAARASHAYEYWACATYISNDDEFGPFFDAVSLFFLLRRHTSCPGNFLARSSLNIL